jgi:hypothetical protein
LSRMCFNLNCAILLASSLGSLGLLMAFRKLPDGADSSILAVALPHSDSLHLSCHSFLSFKLCAALTADVFISNGFLRYEGRSLVSDVCPFAASFASLSASSLPSRPSCPAVQQIVNAALFLYLFFFKHSAIHKALCARWCPGFLSSELKALIAAWLSMPSIAGVPFFFSVLRM